MAGLAANVSFHTYSHSRASDTCIRCCHKALHAAYKLPLELMAAWCFGNSSACALTCHLTELP